MNIKFSTNRKFNRMLANILSIFVILAMAFPVVGRASAQETTLPQGWHDGLEGTVDANSCVAFGWSIDLDDVDRDVQIRILSDEVEITTFPASDYGEDMYNLGICPEGTCRFTVNLWDLISLDEPHEITAQAYDVETDAWQNLEGTPKSLTCLTPPPPSPHFVVFPEWEWFDGLDWPDGAIVNISVEGKPECVTSKESWGYFFNGSFGEACNLEMGDFVTFTDGTATRTHTVRNLSITGVNQASDTITGTADPDAEVYIWPHATGQQQLVNPDPDGNWQADFAGIFDIVPGEGGRSEIRDEMGNATAVDWYLPNPHMVVFPEWEWFDGLNWPDGATVNISVDGKPECGTAKESWGGFFNGSFGEGCDLAIGDFVTFTDGETIRTHTVQNLTVTEVNAEEDTVTGAADEDATVYVWPHATGQQVEVIAGLGGTWQADFTDLFDLVPNECGRSEIRDGAENATAVDWCVPAPPRIYANLTDDSIRYELTDPFASVTFSVYDAPAGDLLWEGSKTADETGFTWVSIWEHRQELNNGTFIVVTDGIHTNELFVEDVSIDLVDADENILVGKAPEGRLVWVVANNDPDHCGTTVETGPGNTWQFDFDDLSCDITADMVFYAQVMDDEGDTSEANPDFIDGWHEGAEGPGHANSCYASGFAVDTDDRSRDLPLRILSDGEEIASTSADLGWSDLVGVCGDDGSCGFHINLWGLISTYTEHKITVQAFDLETGHWQDLGGTPRSLTCVNYDIYAFEIETGSVERITTLENTGEYNPSWSPDGKKIVHDVADADSHALYITDVKTHESTALLGGENGNDAVWSPNGKWIAFDRVPVGEYDIYVVPATGGVPVPIRSDAIRANWAPNSQRLAFHQPSDGSIRTVDRKGTNETIVVENGNDPAWSPDGEWIAFERDGNIWKVFVNNQGNPLGDPLQLTNSPVWEGRPTWSNDSKTITFHAGLDPDVDIWTIPASGGTATWLTGAPHFGDYDPNYSFNGRYVAYGSFSPDGQAAREWVAVYMLDRPAGTWAPSEHSYYFGDNWGHQGAPLPFTVTDDAPLYGGYALLRAAALWAKDGDQCVNVSVLHPDQPTRFHSGWTSDGPKTYEQAVEYFSSLTPWIVWDEGEPVKFPLYQIVPFSFDTWQPYFCMFTE